MENVLFTNQFPDDQGLRWVVSPGNHPVEMRTPLDSDSSRHAVNPEYGELALFDINEWRLPANDFAVIEAKTEKIAEAIPEAEESAVDIS